VPDPNQPYPPPEPPHDERLVEVTAAGPVHHAPDGTTWPATAGPLPPLEGMPAAAAVAGPPRRPRWPIAVAAGVVALAVLVGGGAAAARMWYGSTGALPEQAVPGSTAAFLRINLTPGYSQRVKVLELLKKFPAPKGEAGDSPLDTYRKDLLKELGVSADDTAKWFNDRAGIGVWADGERRPVVLVVLSSSDDKAAGQALRAARDKAGAERFGFVVAGGYALVAKADTGAQAAADAAAQAAKKGSLAKSAQFRSATGALPGDQALLGYTDLDRVRELITDASGTGGEPATAMPGLDKLTGHVAVGAQAVENGIEIRSRSIGIEEPDRPAIDARAALGRLPGNALVAAVTGGLGLDAGSSLGQLGGMLGTGGLGLPGMAALVDPSAPESGRPAAPAPAPGKPQVSVGPDGKLHLPGPDGKPIIVDPKNPGTIPTLDGAAVPVSLPRRAPGDGTSVADAAKALLASLGTAQSISLAITGGLTDGQQLPPMAVTVQLADDPAAKKFTDDLNPVTAGSGVVPPGAIAVKQRGNSVEAQTAGYAAADGTLDDHELFKEAMAGAPGTTSAASYIDVTKIVDAFDAPADVRKAIGPVKAIGLSAGRDGDDNVGLVRIVIR